MKRFLLFIIVALNWILLYPQEISVKAWLDTSKIYIGDQVNYNISISQPENLSIGFIPPADTLTGSVQIISATIPDTVNTGKGFININSSFLITSFDTGSFDIPPVYAELADSNGVVRFFSDYSHLDVVRSNITLNDTTDVIFDIVGPIREKLGLREILPWIFLIIVTGLLVYYVVKRFKQRALKKSDSIISRIPGEPIHITILRELDRLEKQKLWQDGHIKEFYTRLTDILRNFIQLKYYIPALEMTSSETIDSLNGTGSEEKENIDRINEILTTADLSKFARFIPPPEISGKMVDQARLFVRTSCKNSEGDKVDEKVTATESKEVKDE